MNKNLQSPTKLTEFAPLQSEEKQQSVGQFISKLFKLSKTSPTTDNASNNGDKNADNISQESLPTWAIESTQENCENRNDYYYQVDVNEGRSLPNVLKRISNLLALKSTNLQAYSDTELKQYWMPDSVSKECYECGEKFTTFRRRHHCRVCGQIFCSQCCYQQIPGKIFGCTGDLRVCTYCCKVVFSYLQSPDVGADLTADLKALRESLLNKYGATSPSGDSLCGSTVTLNPICNSPLEAGNTLRRKISLGYQEEKFTIGRTTSESYMSPEEKCKVLQNSVSLRNLYDEMCRPAMGITLQIHRYRLRTYTDCFLGSELVDWLIYQQKANSRVQAVAICQALLEGAYVECVSEPGSFIDGYALYKLGFVSNDASLDTHAFDIPNQDEPSWIQQIPQELSTTDSESDNAIPTDTRSTHFKSSTSYMLDLNLEANTVYLSKPPSSVQHINSPDGCDSNVNKDIMCEEAPAVKTSEQREFVPESGWHKPSHLREENGENLVYNLITNAYKQHEECLLKQLLSHHGLSVSWVDTILNLTHDIVDLVRPDKNHDAEDIDVTRYVKFKKVSGGVRSDSKLISGIVCSKNIAHKYMSTKLENPKILLLQCSLVYQRTEGRLMSLEPILMQEHEYLRNVVARIIALQPDIVLVQRNVSRLAQDLLRDQGMTLVLNVKQSVLERLARCTQADLVTSMDAHIGRPRLGTCKSFYLRTFDIERGGCKTLMFFEGLPLSHLGATVLLRGALFKELELIKQISSFLLFASYNWRLEKSYLMDEFAQPPNSKDEFFDDSKENSPDLPISKIPMSDSENKSKLELFSDSENDAEFFSMSTKSNSTNTENNITKNNNTTKLDRNEVSEDRKVTLESTSDFCDPLLSCNLEDDVFKVNNVEKFSVAELPFANTFRKALDDTILCISPYIVFTMPYLETDVGRKCKLRNFFPPKIYLSQQIDRKKKLKSRDTEMGEGLTQKHGSLHLKPLHPFVTERIRTSADNNEFLSLLANFRACGGRLEHKGTVIIDDSKESTESRQIDEYENCHLDALDPQSHKKLSVLFCSYSHLSDNAPQFCVKMVVDMEFYGVNDIPLGCFLERYCFRSSYKCAHKLCEAAMLKHVRRFVHNGGCLNLFLNSFENEFEENGIVMWSWCSKCHKVSPVVPMSNDTWSFSFAKYLELRFYGGIYTRRGNPGCSHSLHHDHFQYFGYRNLVASFKYTPVQLWEISLPPPLISILYDVPGQQCELINEIKSLAQKGHDIYNLISERLVILSTDVEGITLKQILAKEQSIFKQKIEEVQLKLTSPTLENKDLTFNGDENDTRKQIAVWKIEDAVIRIKRLITECVEQWNSRLADAAKKRESDKRKEKVVSVDLDSPEVVEAQPLLYQQAEVKLDHPTSSILSAKKIKSLDQGDDDSSTSSSPKVHHRSQSDGTAMAQMIQYDDFQDNKKDVDKKTVKNIFSQLLPSSANVIPLQQPFLPQEHYTLPTGVSIPLAVYENEPSSIVAYALNSFDYKRSLDEISGKKPQSAEQSPSPVHKRKSQSDKDQSEFSDSSSIRILSFLRSKDSKSDLHVNQSCGPGIESSQADEPYINVEKSEDTKKGKATHVEVQFSNHNTNFFCRIYYAERFSWLRSIFVPDGEEAYIRSLSRCVQWNAQGGKSGSTFSKTMDDRFVLKELPKSEIQLFLDSAQNYFEYLQRCFVSRQPTLLGKIVGIYQIIFRNSSTNATLRTNLLVMENLFYNRKVTHKFDLKGSMRNRLVNPDNQEGEIVLLDENLLRMSCETPLYILPHSKAVLTAAIHNDTEFLSEQSVMDYSLLVGLDSDNKELVLGIIDYIRTFTWDKKLETMVKKSGLLGGQGKLPTIISPKEYRKRFIDAMHRYFLVVPDHWSGLGRGLEC